MYVQRSTVYPSDACCFVRCGGGVPRSYEQLGERSRIRDEARIALVKARYSSTKLESPSRCSYRLG